MSAVKKPSSPTTKPLNISQNSNGGSKLFELHDPVESIPIPVQQGPSRWEQSDRQRSRTQKKWVAREKKGTLKGAEGGDRIKYVWKEDGVRSINVGTRYLFSEYACYGVNRKLA